MLKKSNYTSRLFKFCIVSFAILIFGLIAMYNIKTPGLYYDELLFINGALGDTSGDFIFRKIYNIPVQLIYYIGALKAWIYYPVFKLFPINSITIRLPAIIIGIITLWVNYKFVNKAFGSKSAIIFIVLASVEPSTIFQTKLDWGPTAVMMLFRGLLLLNLYTWISEQKSKYLFYAVFCGFIGIFDKLNFIWIVNASVFSVVVIFGRDIVKTIKKYFNLKICLAILSCILILFYFTEKLFSEINILNEINLFPSYERLIKANSILIKALSGSGVFGMVIDGQKHEIWPFNLNLAAILFCLIISASGIYIGIIKNNFNKKPLVFLLTIILGLYFQFLITDKAIGAHHASVLAPLWLMIIAAGLGYLMDVKLYKGLVFLSCSTLFVTCLLVDLFYIEKLEGEVRPQWDTASNKLVSQLFELPTKNLACVDWGIATIIQGLSQDRLHCKEIFWPWYGNREFPLGDIDSLNNQLASGGLAVLIPGPGNGMGGETYRENFFKLAKSQRWNLSEKITIRNSYNQDYYEILLYKMPYSVFGNEFSKLFSGNGNLTIKNIMSINGFTGTDFQKTNFNDRKIFGSFIKNDSDKAKITIHAKRGSYFLYRSGPVNRNQFIEIENKKFIMPITLDWTWIKLDGSALPEEFNFTLMDNGGSWGEWSAIALIK